MISQHIQIRQLTGAGGAEITGIDLSHDPDDQTIAEIRRAILDHVVVTIPDQPLDDATLACFSMRLGPFGHDPFVEGEETHPNVIAVVKEAKDSNVNFGGNWHSDWSFQEAPPSFTLLHARELPPFGGDTLFANQYLAWAALSPGMRRMLSNMRAIHSAGRAYGPRSTLGRGGHLTSMKIKTGPEALAEYAHPIARKHGETGKTALYVNKIYTQRFEDMTETESAPLLSYLFDWQIKPEFGIRIGWKPNMLTIWDNRAVNHLAINDYAGHRRELHRTTVAGERPLPASN